jgi:Tol biopolymer transport system component
VHLAGFADGAGKLHFERARTARIDYAALTSVPLPGYPGTELAPSFSPDGNRIAFEWFQAPSRTDADLYVKQIGQEHALRLTNHKARFVEPAWSPEGRNTAFEMLEKGEVGVYVIPSLGSPERQLADGEAGAVFANQLVGGQQIDRVGSQFLDRVSVTYCHAGDIYYLR